MKFDLVEFLQNNAIPYRLEGKNVSAGNVNVKCPFCIDDPSFHMGVHLDTLAWSCWRDPTHRGRRPHRLLFALTKLPYRTLESILGMPAKFAATTEFDNLLSLLEDPQIAPQEEDKRLDLPKEFISIQRDGITERFWNYLYRRGFGTFAVDKVIRDYKIKCALRGPFKDRIIVPIYLDGALMCWTARSVYPDAKLRYYSLPKEDSVKNIKDTVFNFDEAFNEFGKKLFIVEGPFDAIKLDYYAKQRGCRAVCLFNMSVTESQLFLLSELRNNYERVVVLLDSGELFSALKLTSQLNFLGGIELGELPEGVKDPGELTKEQIYEMCDS